MAFSHAHKTVIVLDHSPALLKSSKKLVECDLFSKSRGQGVIPLAPIPKTFWTCNVEATVEYARIVYDIFPRNKLLAVLNSDSTSHSLNSWKQTEQNLQFLMTSFAQHGAPSKKLPTENCNMMHGLRQAIEVLCEPSPVQHLTRTSLTESASTVLNRGRIICLTSIKSDGYAKILEDYVLDAINHQNKIAATSDNLMPIDNCELVLVNVVPVGHSSPLTERNMTEVSPHLSLEVLISQSGEFVAAKMVDLAMRHYGLASTTVTGIPMKEEQNASSSANYDVELLHPSDAHVELIKSGVFSGAVEGLIAPSKEGLYAETVTLKWCTPKSNAVELHQCRGAYRMTPVDVNSRPSSCLTNFLLNGRAVMLEQPRKSGAKMISHMLASHGGEIYIHCLATTRSMLEDPPSISEGSGGRVTDYRINDFGELMKETRLAPVAGDPPSLDQLPIERAQALLERMTRLWPMTISDTIIFNMLSTIDPLPSLLVKETMNEDDLLECKKCIYHIVDMESRNEALPVPAAGTRGKGPKRDEQYRQMWLELEKLVRAYSSTSPNHDQVLRCLLECKKPTNDPKLSPKKTLPDKSADEKGAEVDMALKEHDRYMRMTEREKQELNQQDFKSDTHKMSEPPIKRVKMEPGSKSEGPQSVLSIWTSRIKAVHSSRHADFSGRLDSKGDKAELYASLKEELEEQDSKSGSSSFKPLHKSASASNIRPPGVNGSKLSTMGRASPNMGQFKQSSALKK